MDRGQGDGSMISRVNEIFEEIVEIRRDLHMHPELSEMEYRTGEKICDYLDNYQIEYQKDIADTGVVAIIRGKKPGRTVAARADIDALPIEEETGLAFESVNKGVMHACGHDIHTAIQLGVAKIFKDMEETLEGNLVLYFQPAEETIGGAKRMIDDGVLDILKPEYILALHLMPYLDAGMVEVRYGDMNAASNEFTIKIKGKSSHAAYPEKSVDAILIAGYIITALQTLVSRNTSPLNPVVLTLGQIKGGVKNNIIAEEVILSGTLRTLNPETRDFSMDRIREIVDSTARAQGGRADIEFEEGYPALINNKEVVNVLNRVAKKVLGEDKVREKELPSMGSDDFSYFTELIKGAYYNLGCGNQTKGWTEPIHSGKFIADEECIRTGILLQVETLLELLRI